MAIRDSKAAVTFRQPGSGLLHLIAEGYKNMEVLLQQGPEKLFKACVCGPLLHKGLAFAKEEAGRVWMQKRGLGRNEGRGLDFSPLHIYCCHSKQGNLEMICGQSTTITQSLKYLGIF